MKLSRLYSNKPDIFRPVNFTTGLNVVLAEIRLPENRDKDTHNLGKTTLGRLIDFCMLSRRDPRFFLFRHSTLFQGFVFFLEIELSESSYVTVRRSVDDPTKICFRRHTERHEDFSLEDVDSWDHVNVPFDRSKDLLDGILDLRSIQPWPYRKGLGYLLRSQDDYGDVFHLGKFSSAHSDWKPFLAQLLGFNARLVGEHYGKEKALAEKEAVVDTLNRELGGSVGDLSKIEGILLLKQNEAKKKEDLLKAFDFGLQDEDKTKRLVDDLDHGIAALNSRRYSLTQRRKKILAALEEDRITFDPDDAKRLFQEVGVLFEGQIKKDFEQLIAFNRAITDERRSYLQVERSEIEAELRNLNTELTDLGSRRSSVLSFLTEVDVFEKFKQVSDELITLRADITSLERQRTSLSRLQELRGEIRTLTDERNRLQTQIEANVEEQNSNQESLFSTIRLFFSEIIEEVIDRKALLSVAPNQYGHLEFKAEILDESGNSTSADDGFTYRKLLCIAFDMAVLRAHLDVRFPRFVYHDGVFESLDDRKKSNLLAVIRQYVSLGIQSVITLIDSDLPSDIDEVFQEDEIVLRLHDGGQEGRLFNMQSW